MGIKEIGRRRSTICHGSGGVVFLGDTVVYLQVSISQSGRDRSLYSANFSVLLAVWLVTG